MRRRRRGIIIIIIIIIRNGAKTISLQTSFGDIIIIIIIVITRFDCVWMQTQKSPNDPHIRIRGEKKKGRYSDILDCSEYVSGSYNFKTHN